MKGQAIVEMALITPILLIILMAIIEFGFIYNNKLIIINSTRECARRLVVGHTDEEVDNHLKTITKSLNYSNITSEFTPSQSLRKSGETLKVTIEYKYYFVTPIFKPIYGKYIILDSTLYMRIE